MRSLVRETRLDPANFVLPLFIVPGEGIRKPISSMAPRSASSQSTTAVQECPLKSMRSVSVASYWSPP